MVSRAPIHATLKLWRIESTRFQLPQYVGMRHRLAKLTIVGPQYTTLDTDPYSFFHDGPVATMHTILQLLAAVIF